jgi:hypothetical protein
MSVAPSAGLDTFISTRKTKFDCGPDEIDEVGGVQDTGFVLVSPTLGARQRVPPVMPLALPRTIFEIGICQQPRGSNRMVHLSRYPEVRVGSRVRLGDLMDTLIVRIQEFDRKQLLWFISLQSYFLHWMIEIFRIFDDWSRARRPN